MEGLNSDCKTAPLSVIGITMSPCLRHKDFCLNLVDLHIFPAAFSLVSTEVFPSVSVAAAGNGLLGSGTTFTEVSSSVTTF